MNQDNSIVFDDFWFEETPPPKGGLMGGVMSNHLILNKSWPNWDNSILFEDLWLGNTPPPIAHCMGGLMGGVILNW